MYSLPRAKEAVVLQFNLFICSSSSVHCSARRLRSMKFLKVSLSFSVSHHVSLFQPAALWSLEHLHLETLVPQKPGHCQAITIREGERNETGQRLLASALLQVCCMMMLGDTGYSPLILIMI